MQADSAPPPSSNIQKNFPIRVNVKNRQTDNRERSDRQTKEIEKSDRQERARSDRQTDRSNRQIRERS